MDQQNYVIFWTRPKVGQQTSMLTKKRKILDVIEPLHTMSLQTCNRPHVFIVLLGPHAGAVSVSADI